MLVLDKNLYLTQKCKLLLVACICLFSFSSWGQTKGIIFDPAEGAGTLILDPNGDGFVSTDNTGFATDDETESEIAYIALPTAGTEGEGDVSHGASCSYIDFVNTSSTSPLYFYSDGVYLFFRFRIGGSSNSSKTYSVFIDADQKYGFSGANADPNPVTGNPGFEVELSLHTNRGIGIYNVDGNVNPSGNEVGDHPADRPSNIHSQRSVALTEVCGDDDYFYDFYVSFADLAGAGITSSTKMRMVAQSGISANPIIGTTSGTDLGGVDDDSGNGFDLIEEMIDDFPPTSGDDLSGGGPILHRAACPGIDDPITVGATSISGTSSESDGASINVFLNGNLTPIGTTSVSGGVWTLNSIGPLASNDIITASAFITSVKSESASNCNPVTVDQTCSETPTITGEVSGGTGKGLYGTSNEEGGIVIVWTDAGLSSLWTAGATHTNPGEVGVGGSTGTIGEWQVSGGANDLSNGVYYVTVENSPSECESEPAVYCNGVGGSTPPTITTTPILTSTASIIGTSNGDAEVELFIDGVASGLIDTATPGGDWSIAVSDLIFGSSISVKATDPGLCPEESSSSTVSRYSIAPLILDEFCAGPSGVTEIHGISSEPFGTVVNIYTAADPGPVTKVSPLPEFGTVDANGNWSITGLNLLAGTHVAVTNTFTGELESDLSNSIQIKTQTTDGALDINTLIINEGDASLTGNGTDGNTVQLYIDDVAINGFSDVVSGGAWEIAGLDAASAGFDVLYPGGQVSVTSAESGKCESDHVSAIDVIQCRSYAASGISLTTGASVCVNQTVSLSFDNSESQVYYQLYTDAAGSQPTGPEVEGDGGTIVLTSDPLATDITKLYLKAERIGVACDLVFSANFNLSVKGNPALTLQSNTIGLCDDQTTGVITYTEVTNGPFLSYSIDFDAATEAVGFTDLVNAAASSQITFDVPANAPNGNYAGTLTVANSDDASCTSADYAISLKIIENSITFENSTSPSACDANDGVIEISGLTPDVFYSLDFDLDGTSQSITAEAADDGSYRMTNLDQGTYQNFVARLSGCSSNTLQDPVTLSDPSIAAISISDQAEPTNCLNDDGFVLLAGMDADTDYGLTYSTNGNPLTYDITSDAEGLYRLDNLPNGIYSEFQVERLNCLSDLIEESITFVCGESLYNTPVVTPNGDGFNDYMEIEGIEAFPNNKVSIFNRWGNLIWEKDGYLNDDTGFGGGGNSSLANGTLTDGTYFIVIDKGDGSERTKNFVVIKR
ncbi:gliding motility-associated C-terminal domain-containing protein [Reichenbachiella sp.]